MSLVKYFYEITYRYFRAPWDVGPREELVAHGMNQPDMPFFVQQHGIMSARQNQDRFCSKVGEIGCENRLGLAGIADCGLVAATRQVNGQND